jgi:hypothetical protein
MKPWGVWCEAWGDGSSYRAAWLKSNGMLATFATEAEAKVEAARLRAKKDGGGPVFSRTGIFSYSARLLTRPWEIT